MNPETDKAFRQYLLPTFFIDSDAPEIKAYADKVCDGLTTDIQKAKALFYAVRDDVYYDPYNISPDQSAFKASTVLKQKFGFCITKAILLTAAGRSQNIPSRLGFADVRNHLTSEKLMELMQTDVFAFHGYTQFFLEGKWVKATPAFNRSLCEASDIAPLEFDGRTDSIFHEYDRAGRKHMEYLNDHGRFADFPFEKMIRVWNRHYPHFSDELFSCLSGDFEKDAARMTAGRS